MCYGSGTIQLHFGHCLSKLKKHGFVTSCYRPIIRACLVTAAYIDDIDVGLLEIKFHHK